MTWKQAYYRLERDLVAEAVERALRDRDRLPPRTIRKQLRVEAAEFRGYRRRQFLAVVRAAIGSRQRDMVDRRQIDLFV